VRQPGGDLRLADEAVGVGAGQQDLERDIAVEAEVEGSEDPALPPRAISRSTR
jgi:hypothetical protein